MPDDELLRWRNEFPILDHTTYLISNSLGAMPRRAVDRMQEYADTWNRKGVRAWEEDWWELPQQVGDELAPLIGAGRGEVVMHPNITLMEAVVLSAFDREVMRRGRTRIVCEELNFPSVLYLYEEWARTRGLELVRVPSDDGVTMDSERLLQAIDDRTLLVPISHVLFKSAFVQDARAIAARAQQVGAFVVLDAYQSVGVLPVEVKDLGVDFLVGGVLKWLCGGPGGGFLYVRPDLLPRLRPWLTGWLAHREPFAFAPGPIDYADGMTRFLNGTPSIPALYAAREGPAIVRAVGIEKIRRKSLHQTDLIIGEADRLGFSVRTPREHVVRGGTVTLDVPHGYEVSRELAHENIMVDFRRGAGVRIAPHFYNSDEEVVSAVRVIRRILDEGLFRRHGGERGKVT